jgi:hypothetical protein
MGLKTTVVPAVAAILLVAMISAAGYLFLKRDHNGGDGADEETDPNRAPTANAGYDRLVYPGEEVTLDGAMSNDPDGDDITFIWDLDDASDSDRDGDTANDADASGAVVLHLYPAPEITITYRVVLNVSDGEKWDTDTVQVTVMVQKEEMPIVNLSCRYARSPPLSGVASQYILTIDGVSRAEMLMNYSYILLDPDDQKIDEGGMIDLLMAGANGTLRYIDKNPRYQDLSAGDSISAKDVPSVPEGSVFEIYFKAFVDPSGAVTLTRTQSL